MSVVLSHSSRSLPCARPIPPHTLAPCRVHVLSRPIQSLIRCWYATHPCYTIPSHHTPLLPSTVQCFNSVPAIPLLIFCFVCVYCRKFRKAVGRPDALGGLDAGLDSSDMYFPADGLAVRKGMAPTLTLASLYTMRQYFQAAVIGHETGVFCTPSTIHPHSTIYVCTPSACHLLHRHPQLCPIPPALPPSSSSLLWDTQRHASLFITAATDTARFTAQMFFLMEAVIRRVGVCSAS
jgi:hypothetical protein